MVDVRTFRAPEADDRLLEEIHALLLGAFPGDFSDEDWAHALGGTYVVAFDPDGTVVAHAAVVPRALEVDGASLTTGYMEAVAARVDRQGEGLGTLVMQQAAELLLGHFQLGGLCTGSQGFYQRLGWERWQGETFVRARSGLHRTADADDALMVLRLPPTATLDLGAPISCEWRTGDVW